MYVWLVTKVHPDSDLSDAGSDISREFSREFSLIYALNCCIPSNFSQAAINQIIQRRLRRACNFKTKVAENESINYH
jgi:hypothetical protein